MSLADQKWLLVPSLVVFWACSGEPTGSSPVDADASGGAGTGGSSSGNDTSGSGGATSGGTSASSGGGAGIVGKSGSRVVGYLPTWRDLGPEALDLDTLTHLNIAFLNPTGSGNEVAFGGETDESEIRALISAAHEKNVLVSASIAGANSGPVEAKIVPGNVDAFVAELAAFTSDFELDGIDVDIEGHSVNENYEPFVGKLRAALGDGKLLTAAVANWNGDDFSDAALAHYDFINVMAYDHCGPWSMACEHSTLAETEDDMDYWVSERGIPAQQVVWGVPFYGYCWGSACPAEAMTYPELLSEWPEALTNDWIEGEGYQVSLNTNATISAKAEKAKAFGGIMIWELGQDGTGDQSLFAVIRDAQ